MYIVSNPEAPDFLDNVRDINIMQIHNDILRSNANALLVIQLTTFPTYFCVELKKFVLGE